ncbi:MAG: hypothetical protein CME69_11405 [Halobacteriovorax sp.]|nr:hypothetical protein [Halobacteriovorax sp.]MEE3079222.1 hypothetical protein [Bdellovibrionota bacterium]
MNEIIDMSEMNELLSILEQMEDEELAAKLLKELNDKTKELGGLIMNRDPNLQHGEWKAKSDEAKKAVDDVVRRIQGFKK